MAEFTFEDFQKKYGHQGKTALEVKPLRVKPIDEKILREQLQRTINLFFSSPVFDAEKRKALAMDLTTKPDLRLFSLNRMSYTMPPLDHGRSFIDMQVKAEMESLKNHADKDYDFFCYYKYKKLVLADGAERYFTDRIAELEDKKDRGILVNGQMCFPYGLSKVIELRYEILKKLKEYLEEIKADAAQAGNEGHSNTDDVIRQLIDHLQLKPKSVNGKYSITAKSHRQFIFWIVDNNYDDYLTQNNYFDYIDCQHKAETIKRSFREASRKRK